MAKACHWRLSLVAAATLIIANAGPLGQREAAVIKRLSHQLKQLINNPFQLIE
jgi:hypothetical protein